MDRLATRQMARGLGWLSIALGVAELLAPRAMSRATGVNGGTTLTRLYGFREIACGIGILACRNPTPLLWGRVLGDAVDIATVAAGAASAGRPNSTRLSASLATLAGITALDIHTAIASPGFADVPQVDYGHRSGFPSSPAAMRGAALTDFIMPRDMATPALLQSYLRAKA
jgi:hypothetical protein